MSKSTQELLDETNDAISACLKSQAYTIAGRNQQRARLQELKDFRADLIAELEAASDSSGGMCSLGIQVEPSQ